MAYLHGEINHPNGIVVTDGNVSYRVKKGQPELLRRQIIGAGHGELFTRNRASTPWMTYNFVGIPVLFEVSDEPIRTGNLFCTMRQI